MTGIGDRYGNPGDGFRTRPDGRGGILYVRPGNAKLRDIPANTRALEVHCHAAGSKRGPRLVAVVTADWQFHVVACPDPAPAPGRVFTQCRCGPAGHALSVARVAEAVERLRHRPRKGRTVDVRSVALDNVG